MDLINKIRRENGCDEAMLLRAENDPEILSTIQALQGNASRGLDRLSDELYSRDTHFLLEFIQNADDNDYAPGVIPTLNLTLDSAHIYIECNEVGFNERNVAAICKIGESTKTNIEGYIGEKGIGFKSVFKIADEVDISSGMYTFKLDRNGKLGMITPIWMPSLTVKPGWTTFDLHLKSPDLAALALHLKEIRPSLLLFLRRLRCLAIQGPLGFLGEHVLIEIHRSIHREDIDADVVSLQRVEDGNLSSEKYFRVQQVTKTYTQEEKRKGISESVIVLAFPLTENEEPKTEAQPVHAFLPLRSYGFNFIIQADFLASSSREDILSDLRWNTTLRDAISVTFIAAVEKFKMQPTLQFIWFRFLPCKIDDPFFSVVEKEIISKLSQLAILRSADGCYHLPSKFVIASQAFCDNLGNHLIPEIYLPGRVHYLTSPYNVDADHAHFTRLGVLDMSNTQFLQGLSKMSSQMDRQPPAWHEAVCRILHGICYGYMYSEIRGLCILPLGDGSWISANSSSDIYFDSKLAGVPQDLGLRILKADIPWQSWRYLLFEKCGIREADSRRVAFKILELHRGRFPPTSLQSLISHALFMFAHRHSKDFPSAKELRVMDEQGLIAKGQEVYADIQNHRQSIKMSNILPSPARFLHLEYLRQDSGGKREDWESWLFNNLGVNSVPRLIEGQLSPEFEALIEIIDTRQLLVVLKESWPHWSRNLSAIAKSKLSEIAVDCEDGTRHSLKATYLKTEQLTEFSDLPFLPVEEPASSDWDFVRELKVTLRVDGTFYLGRLIAFKDAQIQDEGTVTGIYKQLEARFSDNRQGILNAFNTEPLFFLSVDDKAPKKWLSKSDVVWTGPPSMTSKVAISKSYPSLQSFFQGVLGIPAAGPEILVNELRAISKEWKGKTIPSTIKSSVWDILLDISDLVAEQPVSSNQLLRNLAEDSIFPVESPSQGTILCARSDRFYVPDVSGRYKTVFCRDVPLLSLSDAITLYAIKPVLDNQCFMSHLKYLEREVKYVSHPQGPPLLDIDIRDRYTSKAEFVQRLVPPNLRSRRSVDAQQLLAKFGAIEAFTVDSIETTYTLEDYSYSITDVVALEEQADKISVLVTSGCPEPDVFICQKLAVLLDVDISVLLMIISLPPHTVEIMMKVNGMSSDMGHGISRDLSWTAEGNAQANAQSYSTLAVYDDATAVSAAHKLHVDMDDRLLNDCIGLIQNLASPQFISSERVVISTFNGGLVRSSPGLRLGAFSGSELRDIAWTSEIKAISTIYVERALVRNSVAQGAARVAAVGAGGGYSVGTSKTTSSQLINGILGESFVYSVLEKTLPDFGSRNWTSEFRGKFPGLEPYEGVSLADFMYPDSLGVLSAMLYDKETISTWEGNWPNYHLEVKTTSGGVGERFHMSHLQIQHALNLTMHGTTSSPPKELYIIIRVSGILSSPMLTIYPDPHRLFYTGDLRITSDVEIALGNS